MKIIKIPHTILSTPTYPVKTITRKVRDLIDKMIYTLENQNNPVGVGLAANQVGLNYSIFIIKPSGTSPVEIFINPEIIKVKNSNISKKNSNKNQSLEGCLSIPHIWGEVKRAQSVLLKYQNLQSEWKNEWFSGFKATIIQHEMDHLRGVLFTQRVIEQNGILYEEKKGRLVEILNPNVP